MRIFVWLGSLMMIVALIEFVPIPKTAISRIPGVLGGPASKGTGSYRVDISAAEFIWRFPDEAMKHH